MGPVQRREKFKTHKVQLSDAEVEILKEALDSEEYWQLSEPQDRDSGFVMLDDDSPTLSEEMLACRRLLRRLEALQ